MHVEHALRGNGKEGKGETMSLPVPSILPNVRFAKMRNSLPRPFYDRLQMIRDDWGRVSSQSSHRLTHTLGKQEKCLHVNLVCYGNNPHKLPPAA